MRKFRILCRVCGSRLHPYVQPRGRHINCELPPLLARKDEQEEMMGDVHLISSAAHYRTCGCGALVLAALVDGVAVSVEAVPIGEAAELMALLRGKFTYDLIKVSGRHELVQRDQCRQRTRNYPVLLEHPCRAPALGDPAEWWKKAEKKKTAPSHAKRRDATEPPPF